MLLAIATLPVLVGVWLLPWAQRNWQVTGHSGYFTVQHCDRASLITWSCTGSWADGDPMVCDEDCPGQDQVELDDPSYRKPGTGVWATMADFVGADAHPEGGYEALIPFAIFFGLICYLAALATAAWRRSRPFTALPAAASIVLLVPVTIWLLA